MQISILKKTLAFTLIELMIIVVILGVLAAVAIPAYLRYIKRTKTTEALMSLRFLYDGETAYFQDLRVDESGNIIPSNFVRTDERQPGADCACNNHPNGRKCGNYLCFTDIAWERLRFTIDSPVFYSYLTNTFLSGVPSEKCFSVLAFGDIDDDGTGPVNENKVCDSAQTNNTYSCFKRTACATFDEDEIRGTGVYKLNELE